VSVCAEGDSVVLKPLQPSILFHIFVNRYCAVNCEVREVLRLRNNHPSVVTKIRIWFISFLLSVAFSYMYFSSTLSFAYRLSLIAQDRGTKFLSLSSHIFLRARNIFLTQHSIHSVRNFLIFLLYLTCLK